MPTFGPEQGDCSIYVEREGALSAVGHDLKLRVADFAIEVADASERQDSAVRARFRSDSLRVVGVVRGGRVDESEPSARDRREIEGNAARDVLEAQKFPEITFRSRSVEIAGQTARVEGELELHGVVRAIAFEVRQQGERAVARIVLHQPDFRIKPFRALLGALRVKPDVTVEVSVPLALGSAP
jgi:hypothetical protein